MSYWNHFPKGPSVAERKKEAEKLIAKLAKSGGCSPVLLKGRAISSSYWGNAWCKHIEGWQDHANRLERGRSYVRSGTVVDLRLGSGLIIGKVNGSSLYNIRIHVTELPILRWKAFKAACYGQIESLLDLLQGRLPELVLRQLTSPDDGLFPRAKEMTLSCDCPDGAYMCKHVAAVLYGVGSRLDTQPELLFALRGVDHTELLAHAATAAVGLAAQDPEVATLNQEDLADIFGIELASTPDPAMSTVPATMALAKKAVKGKVPKAAKQGVAPTKATPSKAAKKAAVGPTLEKTPSRTKLQLNTVRGTVPKKSVAKKQTIVDGIRKAAPVKAVTKEVIKRASKKTPSRKTTQLAAVREAAPKKGVAKREAVTPAPRTKAAPAKATKTPKSASTRSVTPKKSAGRKVAHASTGRGKTKGKE